MENSLTCANNKMNSFQKSRKPCYTHHFIYKSKKYNIDPLLVSRNSNYFNKNLDKYKLCNTIYFEGNDEDPDVSDFIQTFLDICHNNQIQLTDENAIPLFYLSYIYDVQSIKKEAEKYINRQYDHFAAKIFQFKTNDDKFPFKAEIISRNLLYHIKNNPNDLTSFSIGKIYEIIRRYFNKNYKKEEEEQIINFLFDCLKHYGREASILFTFVDFGGENVKFIQKLINEFKTEFDFTYINESVCNTAIEQNKELSKIKLILSNNNEIEVIKNETEKTIKNLKEKNVFYEKEIEKLKLEIDQLKASKSKNLIVNSKKEKTVIYQDENFVFYKLYENQKISEVIRSPNVKKHVVIPASIVFGPDEYKVTRIGKEAFKKSKIESLTFSENSNLECICEKAFENTPIQKIFIPSSLRKLEIGWCYGTYYLNEVDSDSKNPYFFIENGVLMYKNEKKREICFVPRNFEGEFIIYEGITRVGDYSFANIDGLRSVKSFSSDLFVDEGAFLMCNYLKKFDFKFNNSQIKTDSKIIIGNICFNYCNSLVSFTIPKANIVELGISAFERCENIKNVSIEADSKLTISDTCFFDSQKLSSIKLTADEVVIGKQSFSNCISITSLNFLNSKKVIFDENAFEGCKSLKTVALSSQNSSILNKNIVIGSNCFSNCGSLCEFKVENATELTLMNFVFQNCLKFRKVNFSSKLMNVGDECFADSKVNSATFEGEDIKIGNDCFKDCKSISSFSIPSAIDVDIGIGCFEECKNIKQVQIEAVSSLKLRDRCFYNAKNLSLLGILGNRLIIGKQSFYNCSSLSSLALSNSNLIFLDENAFEKCKSIETVSIMARAEFQFGSNFFFRGNKLKSSSFSDKNIVIGSNCFMDCCSLNEFKIENISNLKLMKCVFLNCTNLETINFKSKVMNIGDECFVGSKVNNVTFEGEEIKIGKQCFKECQSIKSISIPSGIEIELGESCFEESRNLEEIRIESTTLIKLQPRSFFNNNKLKHIQLKSHELIISKSSFTNCSSLTNLRLNEFDEIELQNNSFENCYSLETISISARPDSTNYSNLKLCNSSDKSIFIGSNCFKNCSSLSEFKIENIPDIKLMNCVFSNCDKLETINFNSKIMNIGDECFVGSKVNNVTLESEKIEIGKRCFKECQSITSFSIPSANDVEIGEGCFEDCKNIEQILIKSSLSTNLQDKCFYNSNNLQSIEIHGKKLIVGNQCFFNCISMTSFTLSNSNEIILGDNAFEGCKNIEIVTIESPSLNLSEKKITIGTNCFINCISLSEINIEYLSSITLKKRVFKNCIRLESVNFYSKSMNIGDECFVGSKVNTVTFEGEEIKIGKQCFKECQSIKSFSIPSGIEIELGESCFEESRNLEEIRIESTTFIKLQPRSFFNNNKLKHIQLKSHELIISKSSFTNCSSLTNLQLNEFDEIELQNNSFENCYSLETISISARSEINAGLNCFFKATKLKSVFLSSKKVLINNLCFANCSSLMTFTVSSAEEAFLGQQTFDSCKNLETIDVSARSRFKASCFCFNKNSKIRRITINSKNIFIGSHCFDYCSSLSQINCPAADEISFFENSFNDYHYSECLKHPQETKLHPFESKSSCNDNECVIF